LVLHFGLLQLLKNYWANARNYSKVFICFLSDDRFVGRGGAAPGNLNVNGARLQIAILQANSIGDSRECRFTQERYALS